MAKESEEAISWWQLGFSRGLTEPALLMGVPKKVVIINAVVATLFIVDFGFWPILFVNAGIHIAAVAVCKSDNQFFDCLQSYRAKKNYYGT